MKRFLTASTLVLSFSLSFAFRAAPSFAQNKGKETAPAAKAAPAKAGGYQKVKTYDFTGDNISGDLMKPEGERVDTLKALEHKNLIRLRLDFIREIVKSGDDL